MQASPSEPSEKGVGLVQSPLSLDIPFRGNKKLTNHCLHLFRDRTVSLRESQGRDPLSLKGNRRYRVPWRYQDPLGLRSVHAGGPPSTYLISPSFERQDLNQNIHPNHRIGIDQRLKLGNGHLRLPFLYKSLLMNLFEIPNGFERPCGSQSRLEEIFQKRDSIFNGGVGRRGRRG